MRGIVNVVHDARKRSSAQPVVRFLKSIQADKHRVGGCLERKRAVGIDDDGKEADVVSIVNDFFDTVSFVAPEKRFASMKVQTPSALLIVRVNDAGDFLETQMSITAAGYPTVSAPQVAFVSQYQATNEGDAPVGKMVTQYVLDAPYCGFHDQSLPSFSCIGRVPTHLNEGDAVGLLT